MSLFCRVVGAVAAMRGAVRALLVGSGVALLAATSLAIGAPAASAAIAHTYLCQITGTSPGSASECHTGGSGTPGGLVSPWGITISDGNVWVADPGNAAVDEFDSSGGFVSQQTGAGNFSGSFVSNVSVSDATGDMYVADSGPDAVDVFDGTGAFVTQWSGSTTPSGSFGGGYVSAAVDNSGDAASGDVYVTDSSDKVIDKLDSSGNPVAFSGSASYISGSQLTGTPSGAFRFNSKTQDALAVDSAGNLYVADNGNGVVDEFSSSGTFVQSFSGADTLTGSFGSIVGVGVDDATGDVYVADAGDDVVDEFTSSGSFVGQITGADTPAGSFTPQAVAVDSSGDVYVTDSAHGVIDKFGPGLIVPDVSTSAPTGVTSTNATLNGSVNPDGVDVSSCEFMYGTSPTNLSQSQPCSPPAPSIGSGTSPVSVSAAIGSLTPGTTYFFRLEAGNANGTSTTTVGSFGPPGADSESTSSVALTTATLDADINPRGFDTTYHFEYGPTTSYGTSIPVPDADIGSGTSDVSVSQAIAGLTPGTTYHFRVVATNSLGTSDGVDQTFATSPAVSIDSESVSNVTDTTSTLQAQINPDGRDTTYQFEYGPTTSYGSTVPATPNDIGSGTSDVSVSQSITALTPNTTYHFRVVATNSAAPAGVAGVDHTFTTYTSSLPTGLPDGRAYELVSPSETDNTSPDVKEAIVDDLFESAADGNAISWASNESVPGSNGFSYLSTRGTSSWSSFGMVPPQSPVSAAVSFATPGIVGYSPDMSTAVLEDGSSLSGAPADDPPLVSGEPQGVQNVFVVNVASQTYQLVDVTPPGVTPSDATFDAGSSDLSQVAFDEAAPLTANAPAGQDNLYEWTAGTTPSNGKVSLVTQVPASGVSSCSGSACVAVAGSLAGGFMGNALHAMSSNGQNVLFTANGNLYVREGGTTTVQVDAPAPGAPGPGGGGQFEGASADGSEVFFTDDASAGLTSDTVAGSGPNLYEYDTSTGGLTDLTAASTAQVQGVSAVSDDGSYVYFVADGSLAAGATAGQPNLYALHGGTTTFIATLSDNSNLGQGFLEPGDSCDWTIIPTVPAGAGPIPSCLSARVSANGQYLVFTSIQSLTGYDNTPTDPGGCSAFTGETDEGRTNPPCMEIYLYNAASSTLSCASCNPSGAAPIGNLSEGITLSGGPPTGNVSVAPPEQAGELPDVEYLQRYVSDTGQVFFDAQDALLPGDTNGVADVYEYEGGQLRLISSGTSDANSYYLDSSPDGSSVFFATAQQLLPQDTDSGYAIYDARVGGGFPFSAPAPACQGDACRPPATAPPPPPAVATVTFSGPANPAATTARSTTKAKVKLSAKTLAGYRFALNVKIPTNGRLTVSAAGVTTMHETVKGGHTYKITMRLTTDERQALARKHKIRLKLKVHILYKPTTGRSSSVTVPVTVKA